MRPPSSSDSSSASDISSSTAFVQVCEIRPATVPLSTRLSLGGMAAYREALLEHEDRITALEAENAALRQQLAALFPQFTAGRTLDGSTASILTAGTPGRGDHDGNGQYRE